VKRSLPLAVAALALGPACSLRAVALHAVADAVSAGSSSASTYASDDDPEMVRSSVPFGLKAMEGLLEEQPDHLGLLTALTSGYTQFAYAFVHQDADAADLEGRSAEARALRARGRRLYLRARDYGLRGLELGHPGLSARLLGARDLGPAMARLKKEDVPLVYWTAASWALAISASKEDMGIVAELPAPVAMMERSIQIDEAWGEGALHEFFVSYDATQGPAGLARAREHLARAVELSRGRKLGPLVACAESVSVQAQDRDEFTRLLKRVLAADPGAPREHRLANGIAHRRARLLLAHADDLFL